MELTSLYYFKTVAESESLTSAAERLHISQPGLSKSVAKLESSLGAPLFIREKGRMSLSPIGLKFYAYVARAFEQIDAGESEIRAYLDNVDKTASIASPISDLLNTMVKDFIRRYSDQEISVNQFVYPQQALADKLMSGDLDFVFTPNIISDSLLEATSLMTEEVFLTVSRRHRLAGQRSVTLASLSGERFLVDEAVFDRRIVAMHCSQVGFSPRISLCSSETQIVLEALNDNHGICFLPASMIARIGKAEVEKNYSLLRVSDVSAARVIYLIKRRDRMLSRSAGLLYNHSIGYFKMLGESIGDYPQGGFADLPRQWDESKIASEIRLCGEDIVASR